MDYQEIIDRRRALVIEPYKSLAEVGFDGPWITPYQIASRSSGGPVLVALHWLDESSILRELATLQNLGYLPNIRFNTVIDAALVRRGLSRSDIYVTQTFHLVPRTRSERISQAAIRRSFDEVTRFELQGRNVHSGISLQVNARGITSSMLPCVIPAGAGIPTRKMRPKSLRK